VPATCSAGAVQVKQPGALRCLTEATGPGTRSRCEQNHEYPRAVPVRRAECGRERRAEAAVRRGADRWGRHVAYWGCHAFARADKSSGGGGRGTIHCTVRVETGERGHTDRRTS